MREQVGRSCVVELRSPTAMQGVDGNDVYFPFASGRLAYDCVSCGAKCCRGHGFSMTNGVELVEQIKMRPSLPLFMDVLDREGKQWQVSNCAPGCFFLSHDGRCGIQVSSGYDAKPETCRLFPFNNMMRVGRYLIVAPHEELCPLEVTTGGRLSKASDHRALLDTLASQGVWARVPECVTVGQDVETVMMIERRIVELSESCLGTDDYLEFAIQQVACGVSVSASETDDARRCAQYLVTTANKLLGTAALVDYRGSNEFTRTMVASTPALRARFAFQRDRGGAVTTIAHRRVPVAMLAIYLIADAARRAGMQQITFQSLSSMTMRMRSLIGLMSILDVPVTWRSDVAIDLAAFRKADMQLHFVGVAKALLASTQLRQQKPLGEVLLEHAPSDALERVLFVKEAARCLAGKLIPVNTLTTNVSRKSAVRWRESAYRWALQRFSADLVCHAAWRGERHLLT
ncbi:MAG: hypothetical protein JWM95_13 [Gemmatimonadetes bacterium]|nr:hypothetical protein [Gemmatimonadota bacterium]